MTISKCFMPIAPSGAGKSTYLKKLQTTNEKPLLVFSLDLLRHEFYDANDYSKAFLGSINDKSFSARANARFHRTVKQAIAENSDLYIDNTNLTPKSRSWYLNIVNKNGFETVAVLLPVPLYVLIERQQTRPDKCVPVEAVTRQYHSIKYPVEGDGEFTKIITYSNE